MAGYFKYYPRDTAYGGDRGVTNVMGSPSPARYSRQASHKSAKSSPSASAWVPPGASPPRRSVSAGTHSRRTDVTPPPTRSRSQQRGEGQHTPAPRARSWSAGTRRPVIRGLQNHKAPAVYTPRPRKIVDRDLAPEDYTSPRHRDETQRMKPFPDSYGRESPHPQSPTARDALKKRWPAAPYAMQRHPLRTTSRGRDEDSQSPRRVRSSEPGERARSSSVPQRGRSSSVGAVATPQRIGRTLQSATRDRMGHSVVDPHAESAAQAEARRHSRNQEPPSRDFLTKLKVSGRLYRLLLNGAEELREGAAVAACSRDDVRAELVRIGAAQRETAVADTEFFRNLLREVHVSFPELFELREPALEGFETVLSWTDVSEVAHRCRKLSGHGLPKDPVRPLRVTRATDTKKTPEQVACDEVDAAAEEFARREREIRFEKGDEPPTEEEERHYFAYIKQRVPKANGNGTHAPSGSDGAASDEEDEEKIPGFETTASMRYYRQSSAFSRGVGNEARFFPAVARDFVGDDAARAARPGYLTHVIEKDPDDLLGLDLTKKLIVTEIAPGGAAARSEIPARVIGMRLKKINGKDVVSVAKATYLAGASKLTMDFVHPDVEENEEPEPEPGAPVRLTDTVTHYVDKRPGRMLGIDFDAALCVLAVGEESGLPESTVGMRLFQVNGAHVGSIGEASRMLAQVGSLELMFVPVVAVEEESRQMTPPASPRFDHPACPPSPRSPRGSLRPILEEDEGTVTHEMKKEPGQRDTLGIQLTREGVVMFVQPNGAAARSGLTKDVVGMRLSRINGTIMESAVNIRSYLQLLPYGVLRLGFQHQRDVVVGESPMGLVQDPPVESLGTVAVARHSTHSAGVMGLHRVAYTRNINDGVWADSLRDDRPSNRHRTPGRTEFSRNRFARERSLHERKPPREPEPDPEMERARMLREKKRAELRKRREEDTAQAHREVLQEMRGGGGESAESFHPPKRSETEKQEVFRRLAAPAKRDTSRDQEHTPRDSSLAGRKVPSHFKQSTVDRLAEPKPDHSKTYNATAAGRARSGTTTSQGGSRRARSLSAGPRQKPRESSRGHAAPVKPEKKQEPAIEAWNDDGRDETAAGTSHSRSNVDLMASSKATIQSSGRRRHRAGNRARGDTTMTMRTEHVELSSTESSTWTSDATSSVDEDSVSHSHSAGSRRARFGHASGTMATTQTSVASRATIMIDLDSDSNSQQGTAVMRSVNLNETVASSLEFVPADESNAHAEIPRKEG